MFNVRITFEHVFEQHRLLGNVLLHAELLVVRTCEANGGHGVLLKKRSKRERVQVFSAPFQCFFPRPGQQHQNNKAKRHGTHKQVLPRDGQAGRQAGLPAYNA